MKSELSPQFSIAWIGKSDDPSFSKIRALAPDARTFCFVNLHEFLTTASTSKQHFAVFFRLSGSPGRDTTLNTLKEIALPLILIGLLPNPSNEPAADWIADGLADVTSDSLLPVTINKARNLFFLLSKTKSDTPQEVLTWPTNLTLRDLERLYIGHLMKHHGGTKQKVARILGIDRKTLYRKERSYTQDSEPSAS